MHLYNPLDSLVPRAVNDTGSTCWGGVAAGECLHGSDCIGIVYADQCLETPGNECCLHIQCTTDVGTGYCKNTNNQTCAGEFVPGTGPPWPCPGPSNTVCCVQWKDMFNGTTTTSTPSSTPSTTLTMSPSPTDTTATTTGSSSPAPVVQTGDGGNGGLTGAQKGGIAGGVVGAVAVTSLAFLVFFFVRKRRRAKEGVGVGDGDANGAGNKHGGAGGGDEGFKDVRLVGGEEDGGENIAMLGGSMKQELDAEGRALHEMESPVDEGVKTEWATSALGEKEKKVTRLAELPGSVVMAELPTETTTEMSEVKKD